MIPWKFCTQCACKFGKLISGHRNGKGQFSFQSQRKAMPKHAQTNAQLHSSHTLLKWCSKFSKPGFSNTWIVNFQMFKLLLEKAEEQETELPTFVGSSKKEESCRKTSISALLTMPKPLTVWITINCGKFFKRWEYQTTLPASRETCSKLGKKCVKAVYCHPAYLTYMQSTSWETLDWEKHKLESRLPGEISITWDCPTICQIPF